MTPQIGQKPDDVLTWPEDRQNTVLHCDADIARNFGRIWHAALCTKEPMQNKNRHALLELGSFGAQ